MQPIKIFEGSFGGSVLYENPDYVCPNTIRRQRRLKSANKYADRTLAREHLRKRRNDEPETYETDPVFDAVYGAGKHENSNIFFLCLFDFLSFLFYI